MSLYKDKAKKVSLREDVCYEYPLEAPFDPEVLFPEYSWENTCQNNKVYSAVRDCLKDIGLDDGKMDTAEWSPFSEFISPGQVVVIKPNLVLNTKLKKSQNNVTTHASVLRPLVDYCWKALKGSGQIIIGDAPQAEADFDTIIKRNGLFEMVQILKQRGVNVTVRDFRAIKVVIKNGVWVDEQKTSTNEDGIIVNLGEDSQFYAESFKQERVRYCGGGYDVRTTQRHHFRDIHEYKVSKIVLEADAVISVPKMKTHKKAGITCCLKNLVGINIDKSYLPHFIMGPNNAGGDEMPALYGMHRVLNKIMQFVKFNLLYRHWKSVGKLVSRFLGRVSKTDDESRSDQESEYQKNPGKMFSEKITGCGVFQGAWPGNNTIWKMILDLNKVFLYADRNGKISNHVNRNVFYVVDGIICGCGNGPMEPTPLSCGLIAAGGNALAVDLAVLKYFDIDCKSIPLYKEAVKNKDWLMPDGDSKVLLNGEFFSNKYHAKYTLQPPDYWQY